MSSFRSRARNSKAYDLIPPDPLRGRPGPDRFSRVTEVEDADFTVIAEPREGKRIPGPAFSVVRPENDNANGRTNGSILRDRSGIRSFGRNPAGKIVSSERWLGRLSDNMFSALVATVFLLVFALAGGFTAVAGGTSGDGVPAVASVTHVTALNRTVNGMPMLVVSGIIENHGETVLDGPRLRAEIYSGGQMIASTLFRSRTGEIEPGESRGFQAKLPLPGGKAADVRVSLAE